MSEQKALKAALLLSRVLCAHMEDSDLESRVPGCELDDDENGLTYEDEHLRVMDCLSGALLLLRGMMLDLAESEDVHPAEVARMVELAVSVDEAMIIEDTASPFWN